jgi:putative DNA primase/helicase
MQGDAEAVAYAQRWCGYALTGSTREHAFLFLYGPGGNGKSVLLNTLAHVMGDYATTADMELFTVGNGNSHPTGLADLRGARLVLAQETEQGRALAEAKIKAMTGGRPHQGAVHAPRLLRVSASLQAGDDGQSSARDPQPG